MHIVNKANRSADDPRAIAVLGFLIEVSLCCTNCLETLI